MSDIDFDELDRAVNGALGITPVAKDSASQIDQPVVAAEAPVATTLPTQLDHIERTQLNYTSTPVPTPAPVQTTTAPAPAARRSSGRFMDMVHPSSDMRSRTQDAPTETHFNPTPVTTPPVAPVAPVETLSWDEPLESPFLPDAKVEKRPLGGTVNEVESPAANFDFQGLLDEPTPDSTPEPAQTLLEAPEVQEQLEATTLPDPIDFASRFSESDDTESQLYEVEAVEAEEPISTPAQPVLPAAQPVVPAPIIAATPQPIPEEPIGPTSITPQYKEQPSSNQESGAIYDTESYHQAVSGPPKKKSGWITLVWIVLLIALGAAAGWAVYTYVLPMI